MLPPFIKAFPFLAMLLAKFYTSNDVLFMHQLSEIDINKLTSYTKYPMYCICRAAIANGLYPTITAEIIVNME